MYLESHGRQAVLCAVFALVCASMTGCGEDKPKPAPVEDMIIPDPVPDTRPEVAASSKLKVKFKGGQRYAMDLSRALGLERLEFCKELGLYDCIDIVHNVTLGGVEPYQRGIREPLPVAPVTAPIAVDRVALQACDRRSGMDFASPGEAVLFAEIAGGDSGDEAYQAVVERMYQRILLREVEAHELEALLGFRAEVVEEVGAEESPQAWATTSCFMIATSMEALFY